MSQNTREALEKYREAARRSGFKFVSPHRLGLAVGESGDEVPNPYTTKRAARSFEVGVVYGRSRAARAAVAAAIRAVKE